MCRVDLLLAVYTIQRRIGRRGCQLHVGCSRLTSCRLAGCTREPKMSDETKVVTFELTLQRLLCTTEGGCSSRSCLFNNTSSSLSGYRGQSDQLRHVIRDQKATVLTTEHRGISPLTEVQVAPPTTPPVPALSASSIGCSSVRVSMSTPAAVGQSRAGQDALHGVTVEKRREGGSDIA